MYMENQYTRRAFLRGLFAGACLLCFPDNASSSSKEFDELSKKLDMYAKPYFKNYIGVDITSIFLMSTHPVSVKGSKVLTTRDVIRNSMNDIEFIASLLNNRIEAITYEGLEQGYSVDLPIEAEEIQQLLLCKDPEKRISLIKQEFSQYYALCAGCTPQIARLGFYQLNDALFIGNDDEKRINRLDDIEEEIGRPVLGNYDARQDSLVYRIEHFMDKQNHGEMNAAELTAAKRCCQHLFDLLDEYIGIQINRGHLFVDNTLESMCRYGCSTALSYVGRGHTHDVVETLKKRKTNSLVYLTKDTPSDYIVLPTTLSYRTNIPFLGRVNDFYRMLQNYDNNKFRAEPSI